MNSGEIPGRAHSLARNGHPFVWWPRTLDRRSYLTLAFESEYSYPGTTTLHHTHHTLKQHQRVMHFTQSSGCRRTSVRRFPRGCWAKTRTPVSQRRRDVPGEATSPSAPPASPSPSARCSCPWRRGLGTRSPTAPRTPHGPPARHERNPPPWRAPAATGSPRAAEAPSWSWSLCWTRCHSPRRRTSWRNCPPWSPDCLPVCKAALRAPSLSSSSLSSAPWGGAPGRMPQGRWSWARMGGGPGGSGGPGPAPGGSAVSGCARCSPCWGEASGRPAGAGTWSLCPETLAHFQDDKVGFLSVLKHCHTS